MTLATVLSAVPRALYTVLALALVVFGGGVALKLHDANVRREAQLSAVVRAKSDTIRALAGDVAALTKDIRATDSAYAAAKATVLRVAFTPQSVRDSIAALNTALLAFTDRGDTVVPIRVAQAFRTALNACTESRDSTAAAVMVLESQCEKRARLDDSVQRDLRHIVSAQSDQMVALHKLAGAAVPRLSPYVAARFSVRSRSWEEEVGARVRLFSSLQWESAVRMRDSLDVVTGLEYDFK